ncbi:hypothetical protein [Amycolatopsis sp. CA-230715]|uniref:hypothetical protein n=1 Tax=Amycolatopsis sp. CA-230715 TaxID=2745196 RepID=UPI001C0349F7|nr:hypothetical protein [Amycolatopsis sp. CA-230715]
MTNLNAQRLNDPADDAVHKLDRDVYAVYRAVSPDCASVTEKVGLIMDHQIQIEKYYLLRSPVTCTRCLDGKGLHEKTLDQ